MAFNVSYKGLTDRNIKYIYSDRTIKFTYPHRVNFRPLKEELPLPPLKRYPRRFYEYYPRYNIGLPRAPAFRETDQDNIERIVRRICKPIECQKARRRDILSEDEDDIENGGERSFGSTSRSDGGSTDRSDVSRKRKQMDIAALVARLQKPTESSRRKNYEQRKEEDRREEQRGKFSPLPPIDD
ncbi:hypothetical protein PoB_003613000 [Plakobranchus ocellatus]|uniref:Uncharacterized protein n=1 Tax=Plakobranchus ocellatus TaxID=259542 RepID=A0AAV4AN31_9GAST|nr:hypothetical protein PoB_003613000 [Plakobranchus ocellatus]